MNQNEQMREVVQDSLMELAKAVGAQIVQMVIDGKGTLGEQVIIFSVAQLNDLAEAIKQVLEAQPAPLVRLTDEELTKHWCSTTDFDSLDLPLSLEDFKIVYESIISPMIAKNGGK